jgi:hypothetical protein
MANPGDKLHYIWGGNMHSVTQSDGQNVCNKSTTAEAFDSGVCEYPRRSSLALPFSPLRD